MSAINAVGHTPPPPRQDRSQAAVTNALEAINPSRTAPDQVSLSSSAIDAAGALRNQLHNADVVSQAGSVLGQADDLLARAAELGQRAGNGILSDADRAIIRDQQRQLVEGAGALLADSTFAGQNALETAATVSGFDPGALNDAVQAATSDEAIDTAREEISGARAGLAATENGLRAEAKRREGELQSIAEAAPEDDLAAVLSDLKQANVQDQIGMRAYQKGAVNEEMVLQLLS